jgi:hypothetical protein
MSIIFLNYIYIYIYRPTQKEEKFGGGSERHYIGVGVRKNNIFGLEGS